MENYFTCKLTVKGSVESMNEFYLVLNSDTTESPVDKFKMDKFLPIPEILLDEEFKNGFSPVCVSMKHINGIKQSIQTDRFGRTKEDFNDFVSLVEKIYGTSSIEEWCEYNWGCEEDLEVIDIISSDERSYCVKYNCVWGPNDIFVKNLHKLYPKLRLSLEYVSAEELVSATLELYKKKESLHTHSYQDVCFKAINESDKYLFVSDYEEADYCIDILGADWVKSLRDDGFTNKNVENWTEVMNHL